MKSIAQRVSTFAANLGTIEDERKALSLDILAEVNKRKSLDAKWDYIMENVAVPLVEYMSNKFKVKVEAERSNRGGIVFKVDGERHEPTRNAFRLLVGHTGIVAKVGSQNKAQKKEQVDLVAEALKLIKKMTPAQKKQVVSALI
jgi:RNAse (barnase) inhibitor barstar